MLKSKEKLKPWATSIQNIVPKKLHQNSKIKANLLLLARVLTIG